MGNLRPAAAEAHTDNTMTTLRWDIATAYDLFISLNILHRPADFGLRKAWAKGVRARLSPPVRETLEQVAPFMLAALPWVKRLPAPKNAAAALHALAELPATARVEALLQGIVSDEICVMLEEVAASGRYDASHLARLVEMEWGAYMRRPRQDHLEAFLELFAAARTLGEPLLAALHEYVDVFFAEEEQRIEPVLREAVARAQALAEKLPIAELVEELSQGIRYVDPPHRAAMTLAPSFWSTPLIIMAPMGPEELLLIFGGRPDTVSLVPGEVVPEALYQTLKALADPTRLRILRYLSQTPMTPAELARRLRLRPPTVSHHLHALRLARLVHFTVEIGDKRRYAVRREAISAACNALGIFLSDAEE